MPYASVGRTPLGSRIHPRAGNIFNTLTLASEIHPAALVLGLSPEDLSEFVVIPDLIAPERTAPDRDRMRSAMTGVMRIDRLKDLNISCLIVTCKVGELGLNRKF